MYAQCTQQVLFKEIIRKSHCGSVLPQTLKELFEHVVEYMSGLLPGLTVQGSTEDQRWMGKSGMV